MPIDYTIVQIVNEQVNQTLQYKSDLEQFGVHELWWIPSKFGDCEDYALLKRKLLADRNIKSSIVLAMTASGEMHVVLLVGDKILDNRYPYLLTKNEVDYKWLKIMVDGKWYVLH